MTIQELIAKLSFNFDSSGIKAFQNAEKNVVSRLKALEQQTNKMKNTINLNVNSSALDRALSKARQLNTQLSRRSGGVGESQTSQGGGSGATSAVGFGAAAGVGAMAVGAMVDGVKQLTAEFVNADNEVAGIDGRLRNVTSSEGERLSLEQQIFDIANRSKGTYEATADLFFNIQRAAGETGLNQSQNLQVAETVNKALVANGASAEQAKATVLQLSQALSSGVLQGDELRSLDENASGLMRHVAEYFGVSVGQLKNLGAQGKLTSSEVAKAILASSKQIDSEYNKMPATFSSVSTKMHNAWMQFINGINNSSSGLHKILEVIDKAADSVGKFINDLNAGDYDSKIKTATEAVVAFGIAWTAVNFASIIGGIATAIGKVTSAIRVMSAAMAANPWLAAIAAVILLIEELYRWLKGDNEGVFGYLFGSFDGVKAKWNSFVEWLKTKWNSFKQFLKTAFDVFLMVNPVTGPIMVVKNFVNWLQGKDNILKKLFGDTEPIKQKLIGFISFFSEKWASFKASLGGLFGNIMPTLNFSGVFANLQQVWQGFQAKLGEGWQSIQNGISNAGGYLSDWWSSMQQMFSGGVDSIVAAFNAGINSIKSFFDDLYQKGVDVMNSLESAWQSIKSAFSFGGGSTSITQNNYGYAADGSASSFWSW